MVKHNELKSFLEKEGHKSLSPRYDQYNLSGSNYKIGTEH